MPVVHALMIAVCIMFQIFHTWLCTFVAYSHWWTFHTWILLHHLWGWQCDWWVSSLTLPVLHKWLTRWHYWFTGNWSIQKAPIKTVAVRIWTRVLSTCVTLWLFRNDIQKSHTSEGTHMLAVQHWRCTYPSKKMLTGVYGLYDFYLHYKFGLP
jgi:hypothetical protein